ncbi:AbiV family abortive infection protein [Streptococcus infantis]|uniref:AbiV family abortive infection protein n=1 Tax=Streptococcus infantis TaxID=68892 RepID=UPI0039C41FC3
MVDKDFSFDKIESILNGTSNFYISSNEELNKCLDHVVQLISDSYVLYINNSYTFSSFLAISVLEEVGKIQMGIFIKGSDSYVRKDKLRDHKSKQIVGASYTICMGERIKNAISNENLEKIFQFIYSGELKDLREKVIYCDRKNNSIVTPKDLITQELARNLLLFAIESFDDNLVGWTNYSIELSKKTDLFFEIIANSKMK